MSFKVIETQEQLDAIIGERVARAKDAVRKEFDGWISPDDLTTKTSELTSRVSTLESALNSANEELNTTKSLIAEKDATIQGHVLQTEKTRIAHEYGLSYDAIKFLQGENADEIKASADALKHLVGANNVPPMANTERPASGSTDAAFLNMARDLGKE